LPWYPTGVSGYETFTLTNEQKTLLLTELRAAGVSQEAIDRLFPLIEKALAEYKAFTRIANDSRPATVRNNLKACLTTALKLNDHLNELDGNSRQILDQVEPTGATKIRENLNTIVHILSQASQEASYLPSGGRLPDYPKQQLSIKIADSLVAVGITPTTTKEGLYCSVLAFVLEFATGRPVKAAHELVAKTLAHKNAE